MKSNYQRIDFKNKTNPKSKFDLVAMQDLMQGSYPDHSPFEFHHVDFFLIILFQDGNSNHTIDFIQHHCTKGTLLTIRKDQIHKFEKSEVKGSLLIFTYDFLGSFFTKEETYKSLLLFNEFLSSPKLQLTDNEFVKITDSIDRIREEYLVTNDEHSPSIIRSELQILISQIYRINRQGEEKHKTKKYLAEFISFQQCVQEKFSQSLKVKDYSKWLGFSTKVLNAATQSIVQKTAKEFIDEICLNHVKRQLINTDKVIKEISYETGFDEPTNFFNFFKKRIGRTPEQYRKDFR